MDYAAFLKRLDRGDALPIVLVHGADAQLLDDALVAVTRALFPDATLATFGREVLDAREASAEAIVTSARTLPLMTRARLVAVRHAQALPAKASATIGEYGANPNPATCLLLLADEPLEGGRDGKAHWLIRALGAAAVVALPARRGRELETWLRQRAAAEQLDVSPDAARLLVEWVGDDTAALLGEARKAALVGGPDNRMVGVNEVTAVVGEHRVHGVFDLVRAVERRDAALALRTLAGLLTTEEPMRVLALLTSEVRTSCAIDELKRRGHSAEQIARQLRRPPTVIHARLSAQGASSPALARQLERCWDVEYRLKSGGDARAEMTALVAELASGDS